MTEEYYEEEDYTAQNNSGTIRRILSLVKPYRLWVVGFLSAVMVVSVLDSYFTYLSKQIIDLGIVPGDAEALTAIVTEYMSLIVVQAGAVFLFIYLAGVLGERVMYDLRKKLFNNLQDLSLSYYSRTPVGWIMSRVTSDTEKVSDLVTWGMLDVTWAILNIVTAAYFMILINWRLALIVISIIPILVYIAVQFRKKILFEYRNVRKFNSKITGSYNESITGVRVIKALGREPGNMEDFSHQSGSMYRSSYRAAWLSALFLPTVQIISAVAIGAVVTFGGLQAGYGGMTVGGIAAFISYITFMMWPIQDLARVYAGMQNSVASAERMFSLIDTTPEVVDLPQARDPGGLQTAIEFVNVSFAYEDNQPVLQDFSLKVAPGESIALVGSTGGGKTTIVNLLCRFYEPRQGEILMGGEDYRNLSLNGIQSRIGVVLQTPHLFSGSIRENIRYGRLDATDAEVEDAARTAGAHEFIEKLGKGYAEDVGEGGNLLSTGQKQLLSIARAVLANPDVLVMDEATSSVDTLTEALIQKGLENLMRGRTSFVIAHRLSTIRKASRILVIEGGRIKEMGSHAELIRMKGQYYRLYTKLLCIRKGNRA